MSWSDEYVSPLTRENSGGGSNSGGGGGVGGGGQSNPPPTSKGDGNRDSNSDDSSRKRQIGLGVGLGVGLLVLLVLSGLAIRWFRRRQKRRSARDKTLRSLAEGVNGSLPRGLGPEDEMAERDHGMGIPWTAAAAREWYTGGHDPYIQGRRSLGYETLRGGSRSGSSLYIPPPPSSSSSGGRPRGARGLYQSATGAYEFTPLTRAQNRIEPIYEADEDEDGGPGTNYPLSPDREERDDDDPFLTPTLNSPTGGLFPPPSNNASPRASNSPTPPPQPRQPQAQDADVQGWVSDVAATTTPTPTPPRQPGAGAAPSATPAATGRVSPLRRHPSSSTKSARHSLVSAPTNTADSEDGRTGSNLSERSAFSFVRGAGSATGAAEDRILLSRLQTTLATAATAAGSTAGAEGRSGSSGTSNSGNSYNTARSNLNFAALQAEGPNLLMGAGAGEGGGAGDDDGDEEFVHIPQAPGSPSKNKPRRSWFGSLRRVFTGGTTSESGSSGTNASGRGDESPTREGLLLWGSSDYETQFGLAGAGAGGMHRRRQAWLTGEGVGNNAADEEDWDRDLERVAEQRTVQIMFTVPREPLRVVNAEVEREESVLIVDPDEEDYGSNGDSKPGPGGGSAPAMEKGEEPSQRPEEPEGDGLFAPEQQVDPAAAEGGGKGKDRLFVAALEPRPVGVSPSSSLRDSTVTTPTLHTAEMVRLERPRTRVLEMVESIESRSREGSPGRGE